MEPSLPNLLEISSKEIPNTDMLASDAGAFHQGNSVKSVGLKATTVGADRNQEALACSAAMRNEARNYRKGA
jgi:hypothetical protein